MAWLWQIYFSVRIVPVALLYQLAIWMMPPRCVGSPDSDCRFWGRWSSLMGCLTMGSLWLLGTTLPGRSYTSSCASAASVLRREFILDQ